MSQLDELETLLQRVQSRRSEPRVTGSLRIPRQSRVPWIAESGPSEMTDEASPRPPAFDAHSEKGEANASEAPMIEKTRPIEEPRFDDLIARALRLRLRGG